MKLAPIMPGLVVLTLSVIAVVCGGVLIMAVAGWPWWLAMLVSVPVIYVGVSMLYLAASVLVTGVVKMMRPGFAWRTQVRREPWPPFDDDFSNGLGGLESRIPRRPSPGGLDAAALLPLESESPATAVDACDRQGQGHETDLQRLTMLGWSAAL